MAIESQAVTVAALEILLGGVQQTMLLNSPESDLEV
jgi:hypothetical protein